jgi:hypothetical protein
MDLKNYGNDRDYIIAWLHRDGFDRLALSVECGKLSARFAKELASTVPSEHLSVVTDLAERFGPRRPIGWQGWEDALSLVPYLDQDQPDKLSGWRVRAPRIMGYPALARKSNSL